MSDPARPAETCLATLMTELATLLESGGPEACAGLQSKLAELERQHPDDLKHARERIQLRRFHLAGGRPN